MEMKKILTGYLLILFSDVLTAQNDQLVTIISPKTIYKPFALNGIIQTKDINGNVELAIQFQNISKTHSLSANHSYSFQYPTSSLGYVKKVNFTATLYREKYRGLEVIHQCSTQQVEIKIDKPIAYTFIQTDKPIYNPRDDVQFRIVVIDKDLKPRFINNIDIEIIDPLNSTIRRFTDLSNGNLGICVEKFTLNKNPLFGDWKIRVTVDKNKHLKTTKSFSVQKFDLPLFGVTIETMTKDYLPESKVVIRFSAGYAFGDYVSGRAELIIENIADGHVFYSKIFNKVDSRETVLINMKKDFSEQIYKRVTLRATISFTEFESGLTYNKSTEFIVHADSKVKLTPVHPTKFTPGFPFDFKVFVHNWKNETYNSYDEVEMDYIFKLTDGTRKKITFHPLLFNGTAEQYTMVPEDAIEFDIQCRFLNSRVYRVRVGMLKPDHESKKLEIEYGPKNPQLGSHLDVFIRSEKLLGTIIVAIMTKYGNFETKSIDCQGKIICHFVTDIQQEMVPKFVLEVYHVRHVDAVDYGTVEITTKNIGMNYLHMKIPSNILEPKSTVKMSFSTTESSRIFLLAVDKRLKFISDTNDIKKEDIKNKIGSFDAKNAVLIDNMTKWHTCELDELRRIESGRRSTLPHSGIDFTRDEDDENFNSNFDDFEISEDTSEKINFEELREHFPQTWLFETIETNATVTDKSFKVPDAMTSWHISAFSVHNEVGLGIMEPKELLVKKKFFIKFNLPYSLRYKEILKVDVMVFNYNLNQPLNAKIKMINKRANSIEPFEFVEYDNCTTSFHRNRSSIRETEVPASGIKRVSFYIRSNPMDKDFTNERVIDIIIIGEATDKSLITYKDSLRKKLRIENFGVKLLDIDSVGHTLYGTRYSTILQTNSSDVYINSYCIISGDYLSEKINLDSNFEYESSAFLEEKTAKLKWNTNVHQFYKSKNIDKNITYFTHELQDILVMRGLDENMNKTSGFTAFLVDTLASAMEQKLITENPKDIEKELNILKKAQLETGEFVNFGEIPEYNKNSSNYNNTKKFFETAYVLIAFLKSDRIVEGNFTDVITKALDFLENNEGAYENNNEAISTVAYVFSLRSLVEKNYDIIAKRFTDNIEETLIHYGGKKMCVKLLSTDDDCNLRHTAYAAMAYINLNQTQKAVPLVYWLLNSYDFNVLKGDFHNAAIMSEPIAKVAEVIKSDKTDITVILKDEFNFEETIRITKDNSTIFHVVNFPKYSKLLNSTVSGYGFISITKVVERTLDFAIAIEPTFHISVEVLKNKTITRSGEQLIRVCANYSQDEWNVNEMKHVIYEIQMPSGYIYGEVIDLDNKKGNLKVIQEGRKKSFVIINLNNFLASTSYCIDIRAVKMFTVKSPQKSSVKVFSFDDKKKFGLEFYELLQSDEC